MTTSRKCALRGCRNRLGRGRVRFCSDDCCAEGRRPRKPWRRRKNNTFVGRLLAETPKGRCVMCQTERLKGIQRYVCSRPECHKDYFNEWRREQRANLKEGMA